MFSMMRSLPQELSSIFARVKTARQYSPCRISLLRHPSHTAVGIIVCYLIQTDYVILTAVVAPETRYCALGFLAMWAPQAHHAAVRLDDLCLIRAIVLVMIQWQTTCAHDKSSINISKHALQRHAARNSISGERILQKAGMMAILEEAREVCISHCHRCCACLTSS